MFQNNHAHAILLSSIVLGGVVMRGTQAHAGKGRAGRQEGRRRRPAPRVYEAREGVYREHAFKSPTQPTQMCTGGCSLAMSRGALPLAVFCMRKKKGVAREFYFRYIRNVPGNSLWLACCVSHHLRIHVTNGSKDRTDPSVGRSRVRERGTSGHATAH